ncbi:uncharacterized protein LOC124703324 [Lolium rigidum]|uniref:uncharacterized protein LOC124703324 n=1 Tax=Lolium rigidum TaxID=89674 RepID=UPI001F5DD9A1|nr:uncharacterized protein LOC124703324 [Lolium rigidum]
MSRSSPQSVTWGHVRSLRPDHRCPPTTPASRLLRDPLSTPMEVAGVPKPRLEEAIDCVMNPHIGAPVTVVTSTSTSTTPASRRRAYSTCRNNIGVGGRHFSCTRRGCHSKSYKMASNKVKKVYLH